MNGLLLNTYAFLTQFGVLGTFLIVGVLLALFGFWYEGKKDGFDDEKLFDLYLGAIFIGIILAKATEFAFHPIKIKNFGTVLGFLLGPRINEFAFVLVILYVLVYVAKKWKWSIYRVLDILALGSSFFIAITSLGFVAEIKELKYLFVFPLYILFYSLFSTIRNSRVKSGLTFASFLVLVCITGYVIDDSGHLPFYGLLITISLVVIYFRAKKQTNMSLPQAFIQKMKQRLLKQDKELAMEYKQLKRDDPYLSDEDRENNNADIVSDTAEDIGHTNIDLKLSLVSQLRAQVKKALDRMAKGKYGISEVSGKPIPQDRLEAMPSATTLVTEPEK